MRPAISSRSRNRSTECELHAALAAELIHQDAGAGISFHVLEEQRWPAGSAVRPGIESRLRNTVRDLRDFEQWIDFFADAAQFAGFIEDFDPLSEVVAGQVGSPVEVSGLTIAGSR